MVHSVSRRQLLKAAAAAGLYSAFPFATRAQAALAETGRIVCGFAPGGPADLMSRWVADRLSGKLARSVMVVNRAGAGGRIAVEDLRSSPADGLNMLLTPSSVLAMYPHVYAKLGYDPLKDMVPVSMVCEFVHALAVGPAVPPEVRTLQDFVTWARANPRMANCANTGDGTMPHFLTIMMGRDLDVQVEPIPYKGSAPGVNDVLGGQVSAIIAPEGTFLPFQKEGRIRVLATTGAERSKFFPEVPTFAEQGARSIQVSEWFAIFAPANTPQPLVDQGSALVQEALASSDMDERFAQFGMTKASSTSQELGQRLQADFDFWGPVVKSTGFTPLSS